MTSLLLGIAWSVLAGTPCAGDERQNSPRDVAVAIEGIVTYDGRLPQPVHVFEAATVRQPVEVDPKTKGLKEAVVWLEGAPGPPGRAREVRDLPVLIDQRNFIFVPHVLDVEAGQPVEFLNSDSANHGVSAASQDDANRFNISVSTGVRITRRFAASKTPVAIGCPVHASMSAWIYVFTHPYHAVTDASGQFRLPPVPPGRYTLQVRHGDGGMRQKTEVVVRAGEPSRVNVAFHEPDMKSLKPAGSPRSK